MERKQRFQYVTQQGNAAGAGYGFRYPILTNMIKGRLVRANQLSMNSLQDKVVGYVINAVEIF